MDKKFQIECVDNKTLTARFFDVATTREGFKTALSSMLEVLTKILQEHIAETLPADTVYPNFIALQQVKDNDNFVFVFTLVSKIFTNQVEVSDFNLKCEDFTFSITLQGE